MKRFLIIFLAAAVLVSSAAVVSSAGYAFRAKLTIDNKVVFTWESTEGYTFDFYGSDNPGGADKVLIKSGIPSSAGTFSHDFISDNTTYYNYYFIDVKRNGSLTGTETVETEFILPRVSKEITNLNHPYLAATADNIARTKELIQTNEYYKKNFERFKKAADTAVETYQNAGEHYTDDISAAKLPSNAELCGALWVLTDDNKYLSTARKCLLYIVDYLFSNQAIGTEVKMDYGYAVTAMNAYDLIYNGLNEVDRQVIENGALRVWVDRISAFNRGHLSNMGGDNTVNITAGLLLKDQSYLERGLNRADYGLKFQLLNGINDDGSQWNYPSMYICGILGNFCDYGEALYRSGYDLFNYEISGTRPTEWWSSSANYRDAASGDIVNVSNKNAVKETLDFCFYYVYSDLSYPDIADTRANVYKLNMDLMLEVCEIANMHYDDPKIRWILAQAYGENRTLRSFVSVLGMINFKPQIGSGKFEIGNGYYAQKGYNKLGSSVFLDYGHNIFRSRGDKNTAINTALFWKNYREYGHAHSDMLNLTMYGAGQQVLFDPGSFTYGTEVHAYYAQETPAHNTVIADGKNHNYGDYAQAPDVIHKGYLDNISIAPNSSVVKAWSDKMYMDETYPITLERTVWQLDDYAIDTFNTESGGSHQYDYLLNINGTLTESTANLADTAKTALGEGGYKFIQKYKESPLSSSMWSNTYELADNGSVRMTMLGEKGTKVIAAKASNKDYEYVSEKLVVRRNADKGTAFINVIQPRNQGESFREVNEIDVKLKGNTIDWAKAAEITDTPKGEKDTFMYGVSYGLKEAGDLTSDAESAFLRRKNGEDTILGCVNGKYVGGDDIYLKFSSASTAQLTKVDSNTYRLDMGQGTQTQTVVTVYGLGDGYNVYKADFDDESKLQLVSENSLKFNAQPEGIYMITKSRFEAQSVDCVTVNFEVGSGSYIDYGRTLNIAVNTDPTLAALPAGIIVEAEDVDIEIGGKVKYTSYDGDSYTTQNPKGTAFFGWDNQGHTLKYKVNLDNAGKYKLAIRYATQTETGAQRTISINDEEPYVLDFDATGAWSLRHVGTLKDTDGNDMIFDLKAGENVIAFEHLQAALNLDCFVLIPVD